VNWTGNGAPAAARHDGGSATVWVLAAMAVLSLASLVVLALGLVAVERYRAGTVADLAALAAAGDAASGPAAACGQARRVATAQRAELVWCQVDGAGTAVVDLLVAPAGPLASLPAFRVRARAGPRGAS
jgi:secretion/DNA translocation related TadE-like protein